MKLNSSLYLLSILFLIIISCKTKAPQTNIETIKFEDNEEEDNNISTNTKPNNKDTVIVTPVDTVVQVINDSKKEIYNIAVVLPFMNDSVRAAWNEAKSHNFDNFVTSDEAEISISFFEGMQMALNDIKFDSKFNITIFDSYKSLTTTSGIINKLKKDEVDIVIGPYSKQNVQEVSKYAKENNIIHISPFTPSKTASLGNEKYYMIEPSLEQHILNMVQFGIDSIEKPFIKYIYHDNESGNEYANLVRSYIDSVNVKLDSEAQIRYDLITAKGFKVEDNIENKDNNVLIVNSFDENFLHLFLRQTTEFDETNNIVFGMPGWENSEIVRLSHLNDAQVHFTTATWIDNQSDNIILFNKKYKEKYKTTPNENAYLGYDIVALLLKMIDENGLDFNEHLLLYKFKGLSRNYIFKKVYSSNNTIHRIENTDLHIYKIKDFEKVLVK